MVTAGVYLIARLQRPVLDGPGGAARGRDHRHGHAILLGLQRPHQRDIKRVLAYSTISQIGYMFLALGVGGWIAAIFHFMTRVLQGVAVPIGGRGHRRPAPRARHFQDGRPQDPAPIRLLDVPDRRGVALGAAPLVTAGFFSKDAIIWVSYPSSLGNYGSARRTPGGVDHGGLFVPGAVSGIPWRAEDRGHETPRRADEAVPGNPSRSSLSPPAISAGPRFWASSTHSASCFQARSGPRVNGAVETMPPRPPCL